VHLADNHLDDAVAELLLAVKERPRCRLRLARVLALKGDVEGARQEARQARDHFRRLSKLDPKDHVARLTWAEATALLEDYPGAIGILEDGLAATRDPLYRVALGTAYHSWAEAHVKAHKGDVAGEVGLLEKGLRQDPSNTGLLSRLLALIRGDDAGKARAVLQGLLRDGEATATVHFALGVDARLRNAPEAERVHLERAYELAPHLPDVANNLAWLLATSKPADLPRALKIIDQVVERFPENVIYRDTRGQIHVKMENWQKALADLEATLPRRRDNPELHRTLALVYERLGNKEMAARHRSKQTPPR
jgi:tetratricopeptide (TPR) repeat protein